MVLKYRFCVLTLFIILITCYIILLFVFINITFTVVCFLRYPFDVTLCLCIPSYFERQNYFMMWLCTYVSCHTLNDKIILFINITFTVNQLFLWFTFDVTLYLCIPSYFEPQYYFIYYYNFNCKVSFCYIYFTWLYLCIPSYFERQNYFMSTCANFKRAILHSRCTQNRPSLMGAFYIDKWNRII